MRYWVILAAIAAFLALGLAAVAQDRDHFNQELNPSVSGTVRNAQGQPMGNVRVDVISTMTGMTAGTTYTSTSGYFEIDDIANGAYEVVAVKGVSEARERVDLMGQTGLNVSLRFPPTERAYTGNPYSISVEQMKVPDKARDAFKKAQSALDKREIDKANRYDAEALKIYPKYADAVALRGILKMDAQQFDAARQDLEQAVQLDPNYALAYIALGAAYNLLTRYDDAIRTLDQGIARSPQSWQAYFEMSKALLGKGQYEAAIHQLDKCDDLAPKNYAPTHLVRAHALLGLKEYDAAMLELETYLQREPSGPNSMAVQQTLNQVKAFRASNSH